MSNTDEALANLIAQRGIIKGQVTRFLKYLDDGGQDVAQLQSRLKKLDEQVIKFEDIQSQVETLDPTNPTHASERETFENTYFHIASTANTIIRKVKAQSVDAITETVSPQKRAKLPKIQLPLFDGKIEEWLSFRNIFISLIHSDPYLIKLDKLHYLRSSLKGQAAQVIHELELTDANYDRAWDLLNRRYHNLKVITRTHLKLMLDYIKLSKEDYQSLRKLLDDFLRHTSALQTLQHPVQSWDVILIHILISKLDSITYRAWEIHSTSEPMPTFNYLCEFLQMRCNMLAALPTSSNTTASTFRFASSRPTRSYSSNKVNKSSVLHSTQQYRNNVCRICRQNHKAFQCKRLLNASNSEKFDLVRKAKLCENCLRPFHKLQACRASTCKICHRKHNTLLHSDQVDNTHTIQDVNTQQTSLNDTSATFAETSRITHEQVILSTALVEVRDKQGQYQVCRVLLDSASQSNFITKHCCQKLKLDTVPMHTHVMGINNATSQIQGSVHLHMRDAVSQLYTFQGTCLIIDSISGNLPQQDISIEHIVIPREIYLADPHFNISSEIDILLGAKLFWELLGTHVIRFKNGLNLRQTHLGYIVTGSIHTLQAQSKSACHLHLDHNHDLDQQLQKFWNIESVVPQHNLSADEQFCETHFANTTTRDHNGRYVLSMPQKPNVKSLGHSKQQAMNRFLQLEHRLHNNQSLLQQYTTFMSQYESLGHMERITENVQSQVSQAYYLPHHAVFKPESTSTKVRVVFDGSMKTTSGISLNETLHVGPVVQSDIFSILVRFRMHEYVLCGDIEKMYRQFLITPQQRDLQRIFWRDSRDKPIQIFRLNTVTYGLSCSSYLATRALRQLALDNEAKHPHAAYALTHNTYVDDTVCGASTEAELMQLKTDIDQTLHSGGLLMKKWCSNSPLVLSQIPKADRASESIMEWDRNETIKTLGLVWNPTSDTFEFKALLTNTSHTKRLILSDISRIYDPLGLIGPIIVQAKIFMQSLWLLKVDWDDNLPEHTVNTWQTICNDINTSTALQIPRKIVPHPNITQLQFHIFSDASEKAFGACIYLRSLCNGRYTVNLIASKSKVAPIKTVTIPRLELCAALLGTQLATAIISATQLRIPITYWTDSTIVLCWINKTPSHWKTFIANRVSSIQQVTQPAEWKFVKSQDNPADMLSRGASFQTLIRNQLWFQGPEWLSQEEFTWPSSDSLSTVNEEDLEPRKTVTMASCMVQDALWSRYSSFHKLTRIIALCRRFIWNCKHKSNKKTGFISPEEMDQAIMCIIKKVQHEAFSTEITQISKSKQLPNKSKILSLNPFLDMNGLLRVGGRLNRSTLSENQKHPVLLPQKHIITRLIIRGEHHRNLHAGTQTLLYQLRQTFWIINARKEIQTTLRNCLTCFKIKPQPVKQIMSDLPESRLEPHRPFSIIGIDYAGPINLKQSLRRNASIVKGYICLFICFVTKAIHIELVTDLTVNAFMSALRRFIGRRGIPNHIHSDNAKTFSAASNQLHELYEMHNSTEFQQQIGSFASQNHIQWHFIPPYSPHQGGLWESHIKLIKYHLKRIVGQTTLTFEQLTTVLIQIEACINSRPLSPMSSDPRDLQPLSPGHFLIGQPLMALPSPSLNHIPQNRLNTYQYSQSLVQQFWSRWKQEYLLQLQQRNKWKQTADNVEVGHLVIIKTHKSPLLVWELGRITEVFPGPDGKVRVVNIHTSRGTIKRPITQIYVLPQQHKQFESLLSTRGVCSCTHERVWPGTSLVSKRTVCSAHISSHFSQQRASQSLHYKSELASCRSGEQTLRGDS